MSESRCEWVASDHPRVLAGRHEDGCEDQETCRGCLPCPMDHCRVCGIEHAEGACPGCIGEVRDNLAEIRRLCGNLPAEVEIRGINGEAMNLLGPVADPEAWGHVQASIATGRLPTEWQVEMGHHHPLTVTVTWEDVYRDSFGHDSDRPVNLFDAIDYLDVQLGRAASEVWVPFEDFARDVRQCVGHLERVLHDGEQVDRTRVTCVNPECPKRPQLERKYAQRDQDDRWRCPACHKTYEPGEYRDAHARQLVHKGAEKYLPLRDAVSTLVAQGRADRTIRKWLAPPATLTEDHCQDCDLTWPIAEEYEACPRCNGALERQWTLTGDPEAVVGGFCEIDSHRVWVWWPDLWRLHMATKTRLRIAA